MWLVDPWHACLLVESRVPIYFVPQVLVNLVIGLGSYRLIFQTATVLIHARAQDFPSQQNATWGCWYPHAAPNHVTRWPLTRLPACGKLRPNLLCATGACQSCHWLRIMSWCIHVCTTSRITRVLVRACWSDHSVPNYVARWPLTRLPACGKLRRNLLCATGACQCVMCFESYRLIFQTATVLIHARAQDFPSQQNATWGCWYLHAVPNHVARWPLTRLPACGKLRPNLLRCLSILSLA